MCCNSQIHDELKNIGESTCPFCDQLLVEFNKVVEPCCSEQYIENINGINVCRNCGSVHGYDYVNDYIDFYENMHRIHRKSIYHRKYHIFNILNRICYGNRVELTHTQRDKIHKLFRVIGSVIPLVSKDRKRMISTKYIIRQLVKLLGLPHEIIDISKSHKTLVFYNRYWSNILALKYAEILRIIK